MRALIIPSEKVFSYDGVELGMRVAQVCEEEFEVPPTVFWIDCPDDCNASTFYYLNGEFYPIPPLPPPPEPEVDPNNL